MQLSSFDEANHIFDKPSSMTREECEPASAWVGTNSEGQPVSIVCWKLTKEEVDELIKTGRIWLWVWGRHLMPHSLTIQNPFKTENSNADRDHDNNNNEVQT